MSYERVPRQIRVPGLGQGQQIGLGDVVKKITTTIGIKPCGGCQKRAQWLNERFIFTGKAR